MTTTTILATTAEYNDSRTKRYLLTKSWDKSKPTMTVIMLYPSSADEITFDATTMRILDNAVRLGYGGFDVVNLYAKIDINKADAATVIEDKVNDTSIMKSAAGAETVIFAVGTGSLTYRSIKVRHDEVLKALQKYESKLMCIADRKGKKFYHPLCPAVHDWKLVKFTLADAGIRDVKSVKRKEAKK